MRRFRLVVSIMYISAKTKQWSGILNGMEIDFFFVMIEYSNVGFHCFLFKYLFECLGRVADKFFFQFAAIKG